MPDALTIIDMYISNLADVANNPTNNEALRASFQDKLRAVRDVRALVAEYSMTKTNEVSA